MTRLASGVRSLALCASTLSVGDHAMRVSRQLAGARTRLTTKALFRSDTELAGFAESTRSSAWAEDRPIPEQVLQYARDFLRMLPSTLPEPAVGRDGEGRLVFEWSGANARLLSVHVTADAMLVYAGRLGTRRRISGAEPLTDDLPTTIRQAIQQVSAPASA